jgi:hypothetical protein
MPQTASLPRRLKISSDTLGCTNRGEMVVLNVVVAEHYTNMPALRPPLERRLLWRPAYEMTAS